MYFFLLVLQVAFDFTSDVINKYGAFFKTLLEKDFEFVLSKKSNPVLLNLSFMLLPAKLDSISKKKIYKKDVLMACDTGFVEIIFTLLAEMITLYIWAFIIQVRVTDLKNPFLKGEICLAIFLALDKQF